MARQNSLGSGKWMVHGSGDGRFIQAISRPSSFLVSLRLLPPPLHPSSFPLHSIPFNAGIMSAPLSPVSDTQSLPSSPTFKEKVKATVCVLALTSPSYTHSHCSLDESLIEKALVVAQHPQPTLSNHTVSLHLAIATRTCVLMSRPSVIEHLPSSIPGRNSPYTLTDEGLPPDFFEDEDDNDMIARNRLVAFSEDVKIN